MSLGSNWTLHPLSKRNLKKPNTHPNCFKCVWVSTCVYVVWVCVWINVCTCVFTRACVCVCVFITISLRVKMTHSPAVLLPWSKIGSKMRMTYHATTKRDCNLLRKTRLISGVSTTVQHDRHRTELKWVQEAWRIIDGFFLLCKSTLNLKSEFIWMDLIEPDWLGPNVTSWGLESGGLLCEGNSKGKQIY